MVVIVQEVHIQILNLEVHPKVKAKVKFKAKMKGQIHHKKGSKAQGVILMKNI